MRSAVDSGLAANKSQKCHYVAGMPQMNAIRYPCCGGYMMANSKTTKKRSRKLLTRKQLELQRISFAFGNAPEGANKWVTRKSLRKAASDRVFIDRHAARSS